MTGRWQKIFYKNVNINIYLFSTPINTNWSMLHICFFILTLVLRKNWAIEAREHFKCFSASTRWKKLFTPLVTSVTHCFIELEGNETPVLWSAAVGDDFLALAWIKQTRRQWSVLLGGVKGGWDRSLWRLTALWCWRWSLNSNPASQSAQIPTNNIVAALVAALLSHSGQTFISHSD